MPEPHSSLLGSWREGLASCSPPVFSPTLRARRGTSRHRRAGTYRPEGAAREQWMLENP